MNITFPEYLISKNFVDLNFRQSAKILSLLTDENSHQRIKFCHF